MMINILFCEKGSGSGGSANALRHLLRSLDREHFRPVVLMQRKGTKGATLPADRVIEAPSRDESPAGGLAGLLVYLIGTVLPEMLTVWRIIRQERIDVVHINNSLYAGMGALAAAFIARRPCIVFTRHTRPPLRRERLLVRLASRIVVLNSHMRQSYMSFIAPDKLHVIHDGIDVEADIPQRPDEPDPCRPLEGKTVIGLAGRVLPGKGHEIFIRAAEYVSKKAENAVFMIVGDGRGEGDAYYRDIRRMAAESPVRDLIHFTGWREDVQAVMRRFTVLVVPYTKPEGLPNIILDAMRLGIPVVSSRLPGPEEIIRHRVDGLLTGAGDPAAVGTAVLSLLHNHDLRQQVIRNGKDRVAREFDIRQTVRKVEALYRSVIPEERTEHAIEG